MSAADELAASDARSAAYIEREARERDDAIRAGAGWMGEPSGPSHGERDAAAASDARNAAYIERAEAAEAGAARHPGARHDHKPARHAPPAPAVPHEVAAQAAASDARHAAALARDAAAAAEADRRREIIAPPPAPGRPDDGETARAAAIHQAAEDRIRARRAEELRAQGWSPERIAAELDQADRDQPRSASAR